MDILKCPKKWVGPAGVFSMLLFVNSEVEIEDDFSELILKLLSFIYAPLIGDLSGTHPSCPLAQVASQPRHSWSWSWAQAGTRRRWPLRVAHLWATLAFIFHKWKGKWSHICVWSSFSKKATYMCEVFLLSREPPSLQTAPQKQDIASVRGAATALDSCFGFWNAHLPPYSPILYSFGAGNKDIWPFHQIPVNQIRSFLQRLLHFLD